MDLEQLFKQYPGLENLYENALSQGYTGTPQDLLQQYGQDFQQNIGGLGSMMGIQRAPQTPRITPEMAQQVIRQQTGAATTQAEAENILRQYLGSTPTQAELMSFMGQSVPPMTAQPMQAMPQAMPAQLSQQAQQQLMAQTGAAATQAELAAMMQPQISAYQRGLLSGSMPAPTPYGYGMATSPYYGYPRNPLSGLLY